MSYDRIESHYWVCAGYILGKQRGVVRGVSGMWRGALRRRNAATRGVAEPEYRVGLTTISPVVRHKPDRGET